MRQEKRQNSKSDLEEQPAKPDKRKYFRGQASKSEQSLEKGEQEIFENSQ